MKPSRWPAELPASAVRFARGTWRLLESGTFYREVVGLQVLAEFHDHDGYDGVVFALPDSTVQLELVTPPRSSTLEEPDPEDALVVFLTGPAAADVVRGRLRSADVQPFTPENPYWTRRGAFGVLDPDGRPVLFVPTPDDEGPAAGESQVMAQVTVNERAFFDALVAADVATLEALLTDDFLVVDVLAGQVATRADLIGAVATGVLRFVSIDHDDVDVRVRLHGPVAVSVGRTSITMELGGNTTQVASRFTHVHVRSWDGWRLLSAQGTPVRDAPPGPRENTAALAIVE